MLDKILYKILFDLKKDVTDLKKLILKVVESGNSNIYDVLHDNMSLFEDIKPIQEEGSRGMALPSYIEDDNQFKFDTKPQKEELEEAQFEEISTISTDVTLSLEKQEKEIIIRALKKNKNKRKYAAQDLGISERTLYRKIKQYDLEDLA